METTNGRNIVYNIKSDIFKPYGFDTCACIESDYRNPTNTMIYSYFLQPADTKANTKYTISCYVYIPDGTKISSEYGIPIVAERSCKWLSYSSELAYSNYAICAKTTGKVVWMWGVVQSANDGLYLMFYPNRNSDKTTVFPTGSKFYFTGVNIHEGEDVYRPTYSGDTSGIFTIPGTKSIYTNKIEFDDIIEL